ncbi:MAG: bifunctional diaminohydroxyphosphoribosylaminopyrimidine deaminase/5-amino-6-(5-phosphoribosylamino)uracil reductase RibD [Nocardioides sp.]
MEASPTERRTMARALTLAAQAPVPPGPNPRVGCVIIDPLGRILGEGVHLGAGTPHAEVFALAEAGQSAWGSTVIVTLEPCAHTGLTGPCTQALIDAGVRRVVFAQADPHVVAAGGAEVLRQAGIDVVGGVFEAEAFALNRHWSGAMRLGRPFVTWKVAMTLDGRIAAGDGTSRWVSSAPARRDAHRLRARCDTIVAGTNTVAVDNPDLTIRDDFDQPLDHQPARVIVGDRELSKELKVFSGDAPAEQLRGHDPVATLDRLFEAGSRHVLLEGGPTLAAAFWQAGVIDEVVAYVAPMLLGDGAQAIASLGIGTIADAVLLEVREVTTVGEGSEANVRITLVPRRAEAE